MRVMAEFAWGIPREHVIGTAPTYRYRDGVITRGDKVLGGLALGPGKPEHIFAYAGRMPAFAGGNADVDIEMLESATFAMLVVHDDADRGFAYTKAAERSVTAARDNGWTVVSVKDDWKTCSPEQSTTQARRCRGGTCSRHHRGMNDSARGHVPSTRVSSVRRLWTDVLAKIDFR